VSLHFLIRFEPKPGAADEFRQEMLRVTEISRSEPGCISIQTFESIGEPRTFGIHSEWADEAAFNLHVELPHTVRFIEAAERLLTHPLEGLRSRRLS
jgi:quinol monooxygenase YgiN